MKKLCQIFIVAIFVVTTSISLYAHSGGTDSRGGHYNRSTGEYHYHHGIRSIFLENLTFQVYVSNSGDVLILKNRKSKNNMFGI
ncbi:MAG: YHYH domain-containing protein [Planctomycetes bacterium]|nr:YHYH domain-containing protein [Planctomycetota bacterium]